MISESNLLSHAHELIFTGLGRILPIKANSKRPAVESYDEASSDLGQIDEWLSDGVEALGFLIDDPRLVIFDIEGDGKLGSPNGSAAWQSICSHFGLTESLYPSINTPSGGKHVYARLPDALLNPGSRIKSGWLDAQQLPGVEIKTAGSYVLVPGSQYGNSGYESVRGFDCGIPEMPVSLAALLLDKRSTDSKATESEAPEAPASSGNQQTGITTQYVLSVNTLVSDLCSVNPYFKKLWERRNDKGDLSGSAYHYSLSKAALLQGYSPADCKAVCEAWSNKHSHPWRPKRFKSSLWAAQDSIKKQASIHQAGKTQYVLSVNATIPDLPSPVSVRPEKMNAIQSKRTMEVLAGVAFLSLSTDFVKWTEANLMSLAYFFRYVGCTRREVLSVWQEWLTQYAPSYELVWSTFSRLLRLADSRVKFNRRSPVARAHRRRDRGTGEREQQAKLLFQAGKSTKEVAAEMGVTETTARRFRMKLRQRGVYLPQSGSVNAQPIEAPKPQPKQKTDVLAGVSPAERAEIKTLATKLAMPQAQLAELVTEQRSLLALECLSVEENLGGRAVAALSAQFEPTSVIESSLDDYGPVYGTVDPVTPRMITEKRNYLWEPGDMDWVDSMSTTPCGYVPLPPGKSEFDPAPVLFDPNIPSADETDDEVLAVAA